MKAGEPTPMETALDELARRDITVRYHDGSKSLSLHPAAKVTHAVIGSLQPYKPALLKVYADPLVRKALHAVDGRISDVFEKEQIRC
jgi:hypothetical protein